MEGNVVVRHGFVKRDKLNGPQAAAVEQKLLAPTVRHDEVQYGVAGLPGDAFS